MWWNRESHCEIDNGGKATAEQTPASKKKKKKKKQQDCENHSQGYK